jgi:IS30 family transposase
MSGLKDQLQEILDSLGEKPPRSRLAPYREFVLTLLRRKYAYRDIQRILREKCQVQVSISTLHGFVRTQEKPKRSTGTNAGSKHSVPQGVGKQERTPVPVKLKSPPTAGIPDEIRRKIAALKEQTPQTEPDTKLFEYDPSQPLHLVTENDKIRK